MQAESAANREAHTQAQKELSEAHYENMMKLEKLRGENNANVMMMLVGALNKMSDSSTA